MTPGAPRTPRGRIAIQRLKDAKWSIPLRHLFFVWVVLLFDVHFFLGERVARPLIYMVHLGYTPLLLMMALQGPAMLTTAKRWVWFGPLFTLLAVGAINLPFASNPGLAKSSFQVLLIYYTIGVATAVYVRTPKQALPILFMLFAQYAWYGIFARTSGLVPWHPTLSNYDAYGALMVQGAGLCFWFAFAAQSKKMRYLLFALAAACVLGVVASFARAAFLCLIAVAGWVWIRSPRKLVTGIGIGIAAILVVAGASLFFESGFFYNEIMSAFSEGTDEGTGGERWELWKVGFKVWMQHPILGVGGGNFGAFAARHFRYGELEAFPNPGQLYGFNLHNGYVQVLSEAGLIGLFAFGWTFWDFYKRNRDLHEQKACRRWAEQTGGRWDLRHLARGLEAANLANAMGAVFYASLFSPWFYAIWIANRMLWAVTRDPSESAFAVVPLRRGRVARAPVTPDAVSPAQRT